MNQISYTNSVSDSDSNSGFWCKFRILIQIQDFDANSRLYSNSGFWSKVCFWFKISFWFKFRIQIQIQNSDQIQIQNSDQIQIQNSDLIQIQLQFQNSGFIFNQSSPNFDWLLEFSNLAWTLYVPSIFLRTIFNRVIKCKLACEALLVKHSISNLQIQICAWCQLTFSKQSMTPVYSTIK